MDHLYAGKTYHRLDAGYELERLAGALRALARITEEVRSADEAIGNSEDFGRLIDILAEKATDLEQQLVPGLHAIAAERRAQAA